MDLVFDIETDDVKATKVHCIVAQNPDSGEIFKFPPNKLGRVSVSYYSRKTDWS